MFNWDYLILKLKRFKRVIILFIAVVLLSLLTHIPATATQPSTIRIAQLMTTPQTVEVLLKPLHKSSPSARFTDLEFKQISDYQTISPGRYYLAIKQQDKTIFEATYGIGVEDNYTLVLFGIDPSKSISKNNFWSSLQWIFGGVEATTINGYLPQARLLLDDVDRKSETTQIRIMHAAPGIAPLSINFQDQHIINLASQIQYPQVSQLTKIKPKSGQLILSINDSPIELVQKSIDFKANALTTVFITGSLSQCKSLDIRVAERTGNT